MCGARRCPAAAGAALEMGGRAGGRQFRSGDGRARRCEQAGHHAPRRAPSPQRAGPMPRFCRATQLGGGRRRGTMPLLGAGTTPIRIQHGTSTQQPASCGSAEAPASPFHTRILLGSVCLVAVCLAPPARCPTQVRSPFPAAGRPYWGARASNQQRPAGGAGPPPGVLLSQVA